MKGEEGSGRGEARVGGKGEWEEGEGEERWGREKKAYTFLNIAKRRGGDA